MPRIFVAMCSKGESRKVNKKTGEEVVSSLKGARYADSSLPKLKRRLKPFRVSKWTVALFDLKFVLPNVVTLLNDPTQLEPVEVYDLRVTKGGRCIVEE
jgi:hypothetical protein